ncbi:MAG TPA: OmpA family protein [Candidatus Krumholzibacteria bacterium]|nr:OmpA family protein [Candidatus Krumholzibacteria bacterium]HRX49946.1 OmpA family protein [Candidatus Krumholzibacteria bacterium]
MQRSLILVLILALALTGCANMSRTQKGAVIGGAAGAAAGAALSDDDTKGAAIGGVAGAVLGGIIGNYLDAQAEEMEKIEGAEVQRIGDELMVTFDSAILFDLDSASLKSESMARLDQMAEVLVSYPDTDILVMGHTDSSGSEEYNQGLSERRAGSVSDYLAGRGVTNDRIRARGYGETAPVADNATATGRAQNRRVEVSIEVNDEFKARAAEQG